uniref:Uncharacterized protein n=1 Tax=Micrurus spixii TaxID=129469 RepID=A0A2D4MDC6_9SAUR
MQWCHSLGLATVGRLEYSPFLQPPCLVKGMGRKKAGDFCRQCLLCLTFSCCLIAKLQESKLFALLYQQQCDHTGSRERSSKEEIAAESTCFFSHITTSQSREIGEKESSREIASFLQNPFSPIKQGGKEKKQQPISQAQDMQ